MLRIQRGGRNGQFTRNVSSSGVYFEFASSLDVGTPLEFVLTLPEQITKGNAVRIRCMGKVVRVDPGKSEEGSLGIAATIERYEFLRACLVFLDSCQRHS